MGSEVAWGQIEAQLLRLELRGRMSPWGKSPRQPEPMGMTARNKRREVEPSTETESLPHAITGL